MTVFELLELGPVIEVPTENPMDEDRARLRFRDLLLGTEYRKWLKERHNSNRFVLIIWHVLFSAS